MGNKMKSELPSLPLAAPYVKFAKTIAPAAAQRMANQYIAKKRAFEAANTTFRKTGTIDLNRIASCYTSDDIFISKSITTSGCSHGLQVCIDWSGSMQSVIKSVAAQFLITALFARAAGIKYEITLFTNGHSPTYTTPTMQSLNLMLIADTYSTVDELCDVYYHMIASTLPASSDPAAEVRYLSVSQDYKYFVTRRLRRAAACVVLPLR